MPKTFRSFLKTNPLPKGSEKTVLDVLPHVLLELAQALRRGKKPNSSSFLPGVNLRVWLQVVYHHLSLSFDEEIISSLTPIEILYVKLASSDTDTDTEYNEKVMQAICICGKIVKPIRLSPFYRGNTPYQMKHKHTNMKRKASWRDDQKNNSSGWHDIATESRSGEGISAV